MKKSLIFEILSLDSDEVSRKVIIAQLKTIKKEYPMPRLSMIKDKIQEIKINEKAMIFL